MENWRKGLKVDPVPALLGSEDPALRFFVKRDLVDLDAGPIEVVWELAGPKKILKHQLVNGAWDRSAGKKKHKAINYQLIETWKQFRFLVDMYGFTREQPAARKAAEFLFSCQTNIGDIRGMLANQYANYYTGAILSLLIKAGHQDDPRVDKGIQWLITNRQSDLGWSEAVITNKFDSATIYRLTSQYAEPVSTDKSRPFSHNSTGMVLRAFAAHSAYRHSEAARIAAGLLKSRFFQPDMYTSYQDASYWVRFQFPFWWNQLVAALDSISLIDASIDEPMQRALDWLIDHQQETGLWKASYVERAERENARVRETSEWVSLAICRILKRLLS